MKYRLLGNSGLRVSELALGTMTFGEDWGWGAPKEEAQKVYNAFRDAGGNFIDTANVYTNGASETFVGEFKKAIAKAWSWQPIYKRPPGKRPQCRGQSRKSMVQAVEASLKRLAYRLHRSLLGSHLGRDHAGGGSHARTG
jgi:aryl-alcohol dehydrogenase-like predicted oxidoreductase